MCSFKLLLTLDVAAKMLAMAAKQTNLLNLLLLLTYE